jgi:hypothetical protein
MVVCCLGESVALRFFIPQAGPPSGPQRRLVSRRLCGGCNCDDWCGGLWFVIVQRLRH